MNLKKAVKGRQRCREKNSQQIVDALIAAGRKGCTTSDLLDLVGISRVTCLNHLYALRDARQAHVGRLLQLKNRTVDVWVYGPSRTEEEPPVDMPEEANGEQDDWRGDWTARRDAAASWF